ncbi:hypothetical protein [Methylomonas sp. HYX-M1]|uniref:DUF6966 domain-containing protein n=1 Tax=Methylomonas sp. HYX-M1 TaxID=3139307 RepID=UPI00345BEA36
MKTLIQHLIACEALLRSVGELFWANKILAILKKGGSNFDFYLLDNLLSWYGGMGSFNDLLISEYNDHLVEGRDEKKLNDELNRLRDLIYEDALRLKGRRCD